MKNNTDGADRPPTDRQDDDDASRGALEASELVVVGVGASAGGLEALQHLVSNLTPSSAKAFIVAQHVSADHRSMMVDLLSRHSVLPVEQASDGQTMRGGHIYVCPPGYHVTLEPSDRIRLSPVDESIYVTKPSIDLLFKSLAEAKGPRSIGVILSGTGSDGTSGVGAIKDVDGFSIAQDPQTAKYDGMPVSAINSGKIDLVLPPDEIGPELQAIAPLADRPIPEFRSGENRDAYERILRLLKRDHSVDFSGYKDKTLSRRIMRRMIATKAESIATYAEALADDEIELNELFHDLLIGVTAFFRNPESYEELSVEVEKYVDAKEEPFLRVWSVGCSTGEEPYSIAIMLAEMLGERLDDYRVQIFATDLNQRSIDRARRGRYSASEVSGLSPELREQYFVFADGHFEVSKRIKQMVVFSQHDVAKDPPFLRQDLVVCRNMIIYFGNELQDALFPMFHYALHPGALMFIGQAESVSPHEALWDVVSPSSKIFRASASATRRLPALSRQREFTWQPDNRDERLRTTPRKRVEAEMDIAVMSQLEKMLAPNVVVLNSSDNIVYSHSDANPLLQRQAGLVTDGIFANVHPDIGVDLRTALHQLRSGDEVVATDFRRVPIKGEYAWVRLIMGITSSAQLGDLTVVFCQVEESLGAVVVDDPNADPTSSSLLIEHEKQVGRLRDQLAIVMEQLDSSNEQMQALNEELQSSNEELQSSNEELETTNEELQSTNEELQTAYAELRIAFDEKSDQERDLETASEELHQANELLVYSESLGKTGSWRWRPNDEQLIWSRGLHDLIGTDPEVTEPTFERLLSRVHHGDQAMVEEHIGNLLRGVDSPALVFRLVTSGETVWLSMVAAVEFGQYKSVQEVVGEVRDVTDMQEASEREVAQRQRLEAGELRLIEVLNETQNGAYIYDVASQVSEFINAAYTEILGWTLDDILELDREGRLDELHHHEDLASYRRHENVLAELTVGEARSIRHHAKHKDGRTVELYSNNRVIEVDPAGRATKFLGSFFAVNEVDS